MAKKKFSTKNLDTTALLEALEKRSLIQLTPPVRPSQKRTWDDLTAALLRGHCDLIVLIVDENGRRHERVSGKSTPAKMTRQLTRAVMEYVIRTDASSPNWVAK